MAGRLGHSVGGTTLAYYAAWVREADQRASRILMDRVPLPVTPSGAAMLSCPVRPPSPYQVIAAGLRTAILDGTMPAGTSMPIVRQLAARHNVAPSTTHRAIAVLAAEHLVTVSRGRRATSTPPPTRANHADRQTDAERWITTSGQMLKIPNQASTVDRPRGGAWCAEVEGSRL